MEAESQGSDKVRRSASLISNVFPGCGTSILFALSEAPKSISGSQPGDDDQRLLGSALCRPLRAGADRCGCLGALFAHLMFGLDPIQLATKARTGLPQWFAEFVATFGLLITVLGCVRFRPDAVQRRRSRESGSPEKRRAARRRLTPTSRLSLKRPIR